MNRWSRWDASENGMFASIKPGQALCIALIPRHEDGPRRVGKYAYAPPSRKEADRSELLNRLVEGAARDHGMAYLRVDPRDLGTTADREFFRLLRRAELLVVDETAGSRDFTYLLGARHALTDNATLVLMEVWNFDLAPPNNAIFLGQGPSYDEAWLRDGISSYMGTVLKEENRRGDSSPILGALSEVPRVFLSYAHADSRAVLAVDQWLRDKGARVDLDARDFVAGRDIRDEIVRSVEAAGKVVCFYSRASADRHYTKLERRITESLEETAKRAGTKKVLLLLFRLDDTELPLESVHRLAINAWTMGFEEACFSLWRHLCELPQSARRVDLEQFSVTPPWSSRT